MCCSMGGCDSAQAWLRGATPCLRSEAEARRTPCQRGGGQEELPHIRGQEQRPKGATHRPRSGAAAESARLRQCRSSQEELLQSKLRGGGQEELTPARGQGWWLRGATPCPRSSGCTGAGGPRRAFPRSRSGGAAVRRYPSSKVRSSGCALLEQP